MMIDRYVRRRTAPVTVLALFIPHIRCVHTAYLVQAMRTKDLCLERRVQRGMCV